MFSVFLYFPPVSPFFIYPSGVVNLQIRRGRNNNNKVCSITVGSPRRSIVDPMLLLSLLYGGNQIKCHEEFFVLSLRLCSHQHVLTISPPDWVDAQKV